MTYHENSSESLLTQLSDFETEFEKAAYLETTLINCATSGTSIGKHYEFLRRYFLDRPDTKALIPNWVRTNRDLRQFWQFIKYKFPTYAEIRTFIHNEFTPLLDYLESGTTSPHINSVNKELKILNSDYIEQIWEKALQRKNNDPDGAITIAKTLLESVLKHILDELRITYPNDSDLHLLYKSVAKNMNLSSDQHTETIFKQILGGCSGAVSGLSSLRNTLGDAHGQGKLHYQPSERHAELAVNLAGTMCLFLLKSYEFNKSKGRMP